MKLSVSRKSMLGLALTLSLLSACKKDKPADPAEPAPCTYSYLQEIEYPYQSKMTFTLDGSNRLSVITGFDERGKESGRQVFKYDGNGKVISISDYYESTEGVRYEYSYSGDKVVSSKYFEDWGRGIEQFSNSIYFYDSRGRNIREVVYLGNDQQEKRVEAEYEYDERGNLSRERIYRYEDTVKTLRGTFDFTYDDKPNPMAKFPLLYEPGLGAMVNNRTSEKETNSSGVHERDKYKYFYNSDNLPIRQHSVHTDSFTTLFAIYRYGCK